MSFEIRQGNAIEVLRRMPDDSVDCCVTSPPYWGARRYPGAPQIFRGQPGCRHQWGEELVRGGPGGGGGATSAVKGRTAFESGVRKMRGRSEGAFCQICGAWRGELGAEPRPDLFVEHLVEIFREVRRVVKSTCWINMGDCWCSNPHGYGASFDPKHPNGRRRAEGFAANRTNNPAEMGLKSKDLVGVPWMLAFALRADGWYLRQEIIWQKPACMPETVKDRPTRSHEQIFLLAKSKKYYYDSKAIQEPASKDTHARYARAHSGYAPPGQVPHSGPAAGPRPKAGVHPKSAAPGSGIRQNESFSHAVKYIVEFRNKRSVWTVANEPTSLDHFAAYPTKLVEPCILAGSPEGGTVIDPFCGLGTTGLSCLRNNRNFIGIELSEKYVGLAMERARQYFPLLMAAG